VARSSSLHDLARMRLDPTSDSGEGVKWKDEMQQNLTGFPAIPGKYFQQRIQYMQNYVTQQNTDLHMRSRTRSGVVKN
jgi:hypothetical protein